MLTPGDLRAACHGRKLIWTVGFGSSFWGLHDLFPENGIVCVDDSPEFDGAGIRFLGHEGLTGKRCYWATRGEELLEQTWRSANGAFPGSGWTVIAPAACPSADEWCAEGNTLCRKPRLAQDLKDKRTLFEIRAGLGLPQLPGEWIAPESRTFAQLAAVFGTPFVAQIASGEGGSGTAIVRSEADWQQAASKFSGRDVWIAPFAGRLSLNVNAIALPGASRAAYPSVQLTGFSFLNTPDGVYCGNDFSAAAALPVSLLEQVREQTERIGDAIAAWGYRGVYGLDFVVNERDGVPVAVDLNPRGQGSTPLQVQAERCASRTPLTALALLVDAGVLTANEAAQGGADFFRPAGGAQVRLLFPGATRRVDDPPRPGVYSRDGEWKRPGRMLEHLEGDEVLLTGGPPRAGTHVESNAQLFRLCTRTTLLQAGSFYDPAAWVERLVHAVFPGADLRGGIASRE